MKTMLIHRECVYSITLGYIINGHPHSPLVNNKHLQSKKILKVKVTKILGRPDIGKQMSGSPHRRENC